VWGTALSLVSPPLQIPSRGARGLPSQTPRPPFFRRAAAGGGAGPGGGQAPALPGEGRMRGGPPAEASPGAGGSRAKGPATGVRIELVQFSPLVASGV